VTTDEQLMIEVQRGSRDAFVEIFERYRDRVWRFFRRRIADAARAEELAQDTFVAVLQGTTRYEPRAPFRSYLFGIAYNLLLAERRRMSHRNTDPLGTEPLARETSDPVAQMWVRRALADLEADDREILMLREYEQLSYEEIADVQSLSLNTVRSRLFRARMALKAALESDAGSRVRVSHDGR
jgi:RNA polymerase sigma-70 factor (ECF subfamily)